MRDVDVTHLIRPRVVPSWLTPRLDAIGAAVIAAGLFAYTIAAMGAHL